MGSVIDWYNSEEIKKLKERRAKQLRSILKRKYEAKKTGNEKALKKAYQDLSNYEKRDEVLAKEADEVGVYWC